MVTVRAAWIFLWAGLFQEKAAVPDPAAQKKAEKLVQDIFKDDFAKKSPPDRVALARKLLAQAIQTDDDPPSRFVLLRDAEEIAKEAGDWDTAIRAIDERGKRFAGEVVSAQLTVQLAMGKAAKTPDEYAAIVRTLLSLADQAGDQDLWDVASKAAAEASQDARKSKQLPLAAKADAKGKQIAERQAFQAKIAKARETLQKMPDDPEANGIVGRQEAFAKGDWDRALPMLAKGTDPALKAAAAKDLEGPTDVAPRVAAGDAWWELAEKEGEGAARIHLRARAFYWYEYAFEESTGPVKSKLAQRMDEIRMDRFRGSWVDISDPGFFGFQGKPGDPITIATADGQGRRALLQKPPPGDFDGVSVRVRFEKIPGPLAAVWFDSADQAISLFSPQRTGALVTGNPGGSRTIAKRFQIAEKAEFSVVIIQAQSEWLIHVDGQEVGRLPVKTPGIKLGLQAESGTVSFDRMKLRRRE